MNDFEKQFLPLNVTGDIVCELTNEQAGALFKCILAKSEGVHLNPTDPIVKISFIAIELLMDNM